MHNNSQQTDHRRHARFELLDYAMLEGNSTNLIEPERAVVVDVSLGGLQIRSKALFADGEIYKLKVGRAESEPIEIVAEVRYSIKIEDSDLCATGFKVRPADNEQRISWVDYVHSVFQSQGEFLTY